MALCALLSLAVWSTPTWAEDSGGVESLNPQDYENIGTPWGASAGTLPSPPAGYPNGYATYPQPAPQAPAPKRSFLGRLFAPITNRMSPPINQAPKMPKETGLTLQASGDPLVRLAKGAKVAEATVNPGFYLLKKESDSGAPAVFLSLVQGSEVLVRVPATQTASEPVATPQPTAAAPTGKSNKQKAALPSEPVKPKTLKPATAQVELSADGQTMVLVYQQGQATWKSNPMPVAEGWQP